MNPCQVVQWNIFNKDVCVYVYVCVATYSQFKARLHQLFPVVVDTKNLCFAVQRVRQP